MVTDPTTMFNMTNETTPQHQPGSALQAPAGNIFRIDGLKVDRDGIMCYTDGTDIWDVTDADMRGTVVPNDTPNPASNVPADPFEGLA